MNIMKLELPKCPRCDRAWEGLSKTTHHAIPLFMKPTNNILIPMCRECHDELNSYYVQEQPKTPKTFVKKCKMTFKDFKAEYERLRGQFLLKKIDRGVFGEGLWKNLVDFLESKELKESKK